MHDIQRCKDGDPLIDCLSIKMVLVVFPRPAQLAPNFRGLGKRHAMRARYSIVPSYTDDRQLRVNPLTMRLRLATSMGGVP